MSEFEYGDYVEVISPNVESYGMIGMVVNPNNRCTYVVFADWNGQSNKTCYFKNTRLKKLGQEKENNKMTGFKNVAIVNLLDDYNKKDYGFAIYDTEFDMEHDIKESIMGSLVVVNVRSKDNRTLGIIKDIVSIESYTGKNVTAQVIGIVNTDGYEARLEDEKKREETRKRKAALIKDVEERIRKQKDIEFYEKMAVELGEKDPELKDLVAELRTLEE